MFLPNKNCMQPFPSPTLDRVIDHKVHLKVDKAVNHRLLKVIVGLCNDDTVVETGNIRFIKMAGKTAFVRNALRSKVETWTP